MADGYNAEEPAQQEAETIKQLKQFFAAMKRPVHIYLFTRQGRNDSYNELAQQVMQWFSGFSDKIRFKTYPLTHELADKYNVEHSPTLVFEPETYNIHWLGAPSGEEGRSLVELLLILGTGRTGLNEDAAGVLEKIDEPRHVKVFVSPSCPYCPQQAVNAIKAAAARPDTIFLEIVDIQAFPEIADEYDAQSVPQTFANDELIALGAQQEELFMASLEKMAQQNVFIPDIEADHVECDLVIVGGGPAGLTAGIYAARSGLNAVVLERNILGGQVATTPVVENYPGMTQVGGKTLADVMISHALEYVQIFQGEEVFEVERNERITVTTNRRKFTARALLLATGAKHRKLNVPGEDRLSGRGVSYCSTCDGPLFAGRKVVMVGGGDSAATDTLHLINIGVDVTIAHWIGELEAQQHLARQLHNNEVPILYHTEVREIQGEKGVEKVILYNNKTGETREMPVDGVFIAIGYDPAADLAEKIGVELTPAGYIKQDNFRTNIAGIYAAGDVTGGFNQIVVASGQGSGAALTIFEDLVHPYWKETSKGRAQQLE